MSANNKGYPNLTPYALWNTPWYQILQTYKIDFTFYYENAPLTQDAFSV